MSTEITAAILSGIGGSLLGGGITIYVTRYSTRKAIEQDREKELATLEARISTRLDLMKEGISALESKISNMEGIMRFVIHFIEQVQELGMRRLEDK